MNLMSKRIPNDDIVKINPCPMCGSVASIKPDGKGITVLCLDHQCRVVYGCNYGEAIKLWNEPSLPERFE